MFDSSKVNANTMHRMCLRKKRFSSEKIANKVAKAKAKEFNCENYVYYCPICGSWHIATKKTK